MSLDGAGAAAGQWVLLVLGLVLLVATILLGYMYKKSKRRNLSSSELELK
jgi:predicted MFS family arabinose efflux permease